MMLVRLFFPYFGTLISHRWRFEAVGDTADLRDVCIWLNWHFACRSGLL